MVEWLCAARHAGQSRVGREKPGLAQGHFRPRSFVQQGIERIVASLSQNIAAAAAMFQRSALLLQRLLGAPVRLTDRAAKGPARSGCRFQRHDVDDVRLGIFVQAFLPQFASHA